VATLGKLLYGFYRATAAALYFSIVLDSFVEWALTRKAIPSQVKPRPFAFLALGKAIFLNFRTDLNLPCRLPDKSLHAAS
jgi:hypothetical protein